jgi:hypothetical protein
MRLADLPAFFHNRDLPYARKVVGTLTTANRFVVATYVERRPRDWTVCLFVVYRFMGHNTLLRPFGDDHPLSEATVAALFRTSLSSREDLEKLRARLESLHGMRLNRRETAELAGSFRREAEKDQAASGERIQQVLDLVFGRGRYRVDQVSRSLESAQALAA